LLADAGALVCGRESAAGPRVGLPVRTTGEFDPDESVPAVGEHTEAVLREAGYDDLDRLRAAGAI
jgi:crotonobetainyl-CoA:carnitine CoA-transferase CaiB-like acyl-CoA transferase